MSIYANVPSLGSYVIIEIINTGSELLLGRILNTHQQWISRRLSDLGYTVARQLAVPDTSKGIEDAVRDSLGHADLVITTGGLGPTGDDVTREVIAGMLGRTLQHEPAVEAQIREYFQSRSRPVPQRTKVEAMVPAGAVVLPNRRGTAPGLILQVTPNPFRPEGKPSWLVMLPGPPRELRPMFTDAFEPWLKSHATDPHPFASITLKSTGIGESFVEERIAPKLAELTGAGLEIGYCARVGEVDIRLGARGARRTELIEKAERIVRNEIGNHVFGTADETLEEVLVREMRKRHVRLALAESCTGGHLANRITNIPGASEIFIGGFITYSNELKMRSLDVRPSTLASEGAVSEAAAREMAEGARAITGADFAVAITGIAGPDGGTPDKPVGTVFYAISGPAGVVSHKHFNSFDRETFKYITAQQAFSHLLRLVLSTSPGLA